MKSTSTILREHLDGRVTAICTCWKIKRTDGKSYWFTDADEDLRVGADVYRAIGAYRRSAIKSSSELTVDNLDVEGISSTLVLPVEELRAGAFDNAEVEVYLTSWMNPAMGLMQLRRGFFGEVRVLPNGTFDVELRGILQKLSHSYVDVFSATCRNDLGDSRCGVDLSHPFLERGSHVSVPLLDSDFEETGRHGLERSGSWYDPTGSGENLFTTAPTNTGAFAATGGEVGHLQQDVALAKLGEDFINHLDAEQVTMRLHAFRRGVGAEGRLAVRFLDDRNRAVRVARSFRPAANANSVLPTSVVLPAEWTIEFWARTPRFTASRRIIRGTSGSFTFEVLTTANANSNGFQSIQLGFIISGVRTSSMMQNTASFDDGEWHHLAFRRVGDRIDLHIDAIPCGSAQIGSRDVGQPFSISEIGSGPSFEIDELRIWDHPREQWQLASMRFHDIASDAAGLVRYYPFEDHASDVSPAGAGAITSSTGVGVRPSDAAPVAAALRGDEAGYTTGYQEATDTWEIVTLEGPVPRHARAAQITFEGRAGVSPASAALLDSVFGSFFDASSLTRMPNLDEDGDHWMRAGMVVSGGNNRTFRAQITDPRAVDGWFNGGLVTFYSGDNAGGSMEVKSWIQETGEIELFLSMPRPIQPGDTFTVYPGCDKTRICCAALFDNTVNMFATPDVPGEDELLRYPDAN